MDLREGKGKGYSYGSSAWWEKIWNLTGVIYYYLI
jgi:hypothetical protein